VHVTCVVGLHVFFSTGVGPSTCVCMYMGFLLWLYFFLKFCVGVCLYWLGLQQASLVLVVPSPQKYVLLSCESLVRYQVGNVH